MKFTEIEYKRPNIESITKEFKQLLAEIDEASDLASFEKSMLKINKIRESFESFQSLAHVRHSIDTKDEYYDAENQFFDQNSPVFSQLSNKFYKKINESGLKNEIIKKYGSHFTNGIECSLKTFDEKIMDLLSAENELVSQYNKLIGGAEVEFDGKKLTLSQLAPYATSTDRSMRKKASDTSNAWFDEKGEELDEIFDNLVQLRTKIATDLGYDNFVQLAYDRLGRADYGSKEVAQFRDAVHEHIVPVVNELRDRQKTRIEVDQLEYYDLSFQFKTGNPQPKGDPKFIIEGGKKMYSELSAETKEFFEFMQNNELMDLESKSGKMAGGYCTYIPAFKSPFIFSNFNGTSGDIDVLTHEAGHAFQIYNSRDMPLPEYYWPTLEACEIHSMSMEFLTWNWMELFFKEDTEKYKFSHLSSGLLFLPYGVAIDEFQHWIYENPSVSARERNQKWLTIEAKYMPYKANSSSEYIETGRSWQKQGHLYRVPFYYIDYTLAQVCAYQFWKESQVDFTSAWNRYLALCKLGGSDSFTGLLKKAALKDPFNPELLKEVGSWVKEYIENVDDSKF